MTKNNIFINLEEYKRSNIEYSEKMTIYNIAHYHKRSLRKVKDILFNKILFILMNHKKLCKDVVIYKIMRFVNKKN